MVRVRLLQGQLATNPCRSAGKQGLWRGVASGAATGRGGGAGETAGASGSKVGAEATARTERVVYSWCCIVLQWLPRRRPSSA